MKTDLEHSKHKKSQTDKACQYDERGYSLCQATDGASQQANKTSWTDGAHSDLLTARFRIYSLISSVSRTKRVMQKWCVIAGFNRTCSVETSQPVGNYQTEEFIVSDLLEQGTTKGKCGAAFPPCSSPPFHPQSGYLSFRQR